MSADEPADDKAAKGTVQIENTRTRVTEWRFARRGDATGWHRHDHDYVIVPLFTGALDILQSDGTTTRADLHHGVPYFRAAGVEHDVINANDFECAFVEVEFLS